MRLHRINFFESVDINTNDVDVAWVDRALDLAVLRISQRAASKLNSVQSVDISSLGGQNDFACAQPGGRARYALAGFPHEIKELSKSTVVWFPLVYRTTVKSNDGVSRLLLDYRSSGSASKLPNPEGISGSMVFEIPGAADGDLWAPGLAVAVQHSWKRTEEHLVCSPIAPIREFLLRA